MQWIKIHAGTATDPKFRLVARDAGASTAEALGVWLMLLDKAGDADGDASGFNPRLADIAFDMADGKAEAIITAMQDLKMLDAMYVVNWDKRQGIKNGAKSSGSTQPKTGAERQREYRERQRAGKQPEGRNANVTERYENCDGVTERYENCDGVTERYVTCNGERNGVTESNVTHNAVTESNVTHNAESNALKEKNRIDKIKNNIKNPPLPPLGECGGDGDEESSHTCHPEENLQPEQQDETPQDEPGIEFQEAREFWDSNMRCEGPMAGFKEYKTLKKARDRTGMSCWPGLGVIRSDVLKRKEARVWNPGYEIGLGRYLAEKTWLAPIVARASPRAARPGEPAAPTEFQKNMQDRRLMAGMLLQKRISAQNRQEKAYGAIDAQRIAAGAASGTGAGGTGLPDAAYAGRAGAAG